MLNNGVTTYGDPKLSTHLLPLSNGNSRRAAQFFATLFIVIILVRVVPLELRMQLEASPIGQEQKEIVRIQDLEYCLFLGPLGLYKPRQVD